MDFKAKKEKLQNDFNATKMRQMQLEAELEAVKQLLFRMQGQFAQLEELEAELSTTPKPEGE